MNVILNEELLEDARRITGEPTYSGAINHALMELVRVRRLREKLTELDELAKEGPIFREGYLAEIRPNAYSVLNSKPPRKKKRAARTR